MKTKLTYGFIVALMLALSAGMAWSQATAGKVQGTITQGGKPLANAQVVLTNKDTGKTYQMKTDKSGQFSGVGIQFGVYDQVVSDVSGEKLFKRTVQVTGEGGAVQDLSVDVSAGKGPAMSEAEVAKLKSENEKAVNQNAIIAQLNPALQAKNWAAAEPLLTQLV